MRVIPTLYRNDWYLGGMITDQPFNKYAAEVIGGSKLWTPRRKWDGVAMLYSQNGTWFRRQRLKHGAPEPADFTETYASSRRHSDGKPNVRFGWTAPDGNVLASLRQAILVDVPELVPGETYELCGPGICGNKEQLRVPRLIRHATAEVCEDLAGKELEFQGVRRYFKTTLASRGWEGIVWWRDVQPCRYPLLLKLRVADFQPV